MSRLRAQVAELITNIKPDLVHCLRLPIEGYLGGLTDFRPLVVSSWGNDLIYWSTLTPIHRFLTERCLSNAEVFLPDTTRDACLAYRFGLQPNARVVAMPATGGIDFKWFEHLSSSEAKSRTVTDGDRKSCLVVSSRGFGNVYVNTPVLISAVPLVLRAYPDTKFVVDGNYDSPSYCLLSKQVRSLKLEGAVQLTNRLSHDDLMRQFQRSSAYVSVTRFDGLPISMLEAMALGTIPVVSDLPPLREWVKEGVNGYLVDPSSPESVAKGIVRALDSDHRRRSIAEYNKQRLQEWADYRKNLSSLELCYKEALRKCNNMVDLER